MGNIYFDDFNRADSSPDSNTAWEQQSSSATGRGAIVSNKLEINTLTLTAEESYNGFTTAGDCYAKIGFTTFTGAGLADIGVLIRCPTPLDRTFYQGVGVKNSTDTTEINKRIAGANTSLATENATTWAATDTLELRATGANTLIVYRNGSSLLDGSGDSALSTGRVGRRIKENGTITNTEGDNFEGGDYAARLEQTHYRFREDNGGLAAPLF